MQKFYANLDSSEQAVLAAASRIFSAFVASGHYSEQNEKALVEKSVHLALQLTQKTEDCVLTQDENP